MPGLSKVIVLDPDARARRQVQLGFEREGVQTAAAATEAELAVPGEDTGLVVVGGVDGHGVELVRRARGWLAGRGIDVPLVFAGRGAEPRDATAAGADEVVRHPAYLRDVVTIGRLLVGRPADQRDRIVGNLIELTGVFTLVRALSALGRSATLTFIRGLRRGEVRFYFGEVTSAQVGLIHGQAALHQLLLWTDARFDFHHQDVVRRQQIPLSRDELFADAERFLEGVRDSSGGLSPAMVLEQDLPRVQALAKQIPTEVYGVLRMFDGHRALADVLEDSAYRVFETLRVAQRAVEAGLIRVVDKPPPRPGWRTVLAIEDWLVGGEPRDAVPASDAVSDAVSVAVNDPRPATIRDARGAPPVPPPKAAGQSGKTARKRRKKKRRSDTPPAVAAGAAGIPEIDWGALVPRIVGAEVGPLAGVVPASHVSGEIVTTARSSRGAGDAPPPEPTPEPTIVFDEAADRAEAERVVAQRAAEARARAAAERAAAEARAAAERAAAEARDSAECAAAEARAGAEQAAAAALARAQAERAEAEARAAAQAERAAAEARTAAQAEQAGALALARAEAERAEAERIAADAHVRAEAERAEAERVAAERAAAEAHAAAEAERAEAERAAAERAEAERVAIERASAEVEQAAAMALARAEAERIAAERAAARADVRARAERARAERVEAERAAAEARAHAEAERARAERVEAERAAAEAHPRTEADRAAAEAHPRTEADRPEAERAAAEARAEAERAAADRAETEAPARAEAEPAAADRAEAHARAEAEPAAADADRAEAEPAAADADRAEAEPAAADADRAEAEAHARAEAEAHARAEAEAHARAVADRAEAEPAAAEADRDADRADADHADADRADADRADAEPAAADRADADRVEAERAAAEAHPRAEAHARAEAERAAAEAHPRAEADRVEAERADAEAHARAEADRAEADRAAVEGKRAEAERTEADDDDDAAEARANAIRAVAATVSVSSEPAHVVNDLELSDTRPERPGAVRKPAVDPAAAAGSEVVAEPEVPGTAIVEDSVGAVASDAITAPMAAVSPPDDAAEPVAGAPDAVAAPAAARAEASTPTAVVDEPSDGVVRHHIATAETAPVKRRNLPHDPRDDDRPGETTGEITMPRARPHVVIRYSEPTILVPDLANIQAEVGEIDPAAPPARAARPAGGGAHGDPAFSDTEEAFFEAGHDDKVAGHHDGESFDDLDEGYRPVGFWERLTGRGKPGKPSKKPR